jgi:hypothetical protein
MLSSRAEPVPMTRVLLIAVGAAIAAVSAAGCGARSSLPEESAPSQGGGGAASTSSSGGATPTTTTSTAPACADGDVQPCGSSVGECKPGKQVCKAGVFGPCTGDVGPAPEACNGKDDNCDGQIDEGFGVGQACDGPDADLCADDVMTCDGCSAGKDNIEICNGKDDDCNGVVDADCKVGSCMPTLIVGDIDKSMDSCFVDSVQPGKMGMLDFPCSGGPVSATFGPILFTGSVQNGMIAMDATTTFDWLDGCTWSSSQIITGTLASGSLAYSYSEKPILGKGCETPCTASGTILVQW